jgi:hypothetical protein
MSNQLIKLSKVGDSCTIYRYDNGWMLEITGRSMSGEWKTLKIICASENELVDLIKTYNLTELDN